MNLLAFSFVAGQARSRSSLKSLRRFGALALAMLGLSIGLAKAQEPEPVAPRELSVAFDLALSQGEHLGTALDPVPDRIIRDQANGDKLLAIINSWDLPTALKRVGETSQLAISIGLMSDAADEAVFNKLLTESRPKLLSFADQIIQAPTAENQLELLFLLEWLALTPSDETADRIIRAAKAGIASEHSNWSFVLIPREVEFSTKIVEALSDPIPPGMIGLGLLECTNDLQRSGVELNHPFDTDAGMAILSEYLSNTSPEGSSNAVSATAALPFLTHDRRNELLQKAIDYPHPLVKAEAGYALVLLEDERGIRLIQSVCRDVRYSRAAQEYLKELGAEDQIPAEAKEDGFAVRAEFCFYLSDPNILGEPPTEIEPVGSQVLYWPATKDRRRMSVVKFKYLDSEGKVLHEGMGVVGSQTLWLPRFTNMEMSGGDVLAIHCCYELIANRDPDAPEKIDAATGLDIIRRAQTANPAPRATDGQRNR